ncbi:MAG: reactive intermediate/imine deaminase [Synergistales bacterium]|nr:reactive intermediate/imine deaminase [Synergistales bacterium]
MNIREVRSSKAPLPRGCYSQAVILGNVLYSAGQLPIDPESGEMVRGSVSEQAKRVMENIRGILEEAGSSMEQVVKATVYLRDVFSWEEFNKVYSDHFTGDIPPARTVISGVDIHFGFDIEMEVVAYVPDM